MMDSITSKSVDLNISNLSAEKSICIEIHESGDPAVITISSEDVDIPKVTNKVLDLVYSPRFVPTAPERNCCHHVNTLIWNVFMLLKDSCSFCAEGINKVWFRRYDLVFYLALMVFFSEL